MALNIDAIFEEKLTYTFKNKMINLANFHQNTFESLKIGAFMGSFYPKQKMYELIIYRGDLCHDIKHKRMTQNLKRNWLVSSKLTWGIWQILTWALENLKNLHFNRLLLTKVNNVWAKKSIEELFLMELNIDAKFEGKMTCAFKNGMR